MRKPKAPKTRNDNTLSEAEYFQKIRSSLRDGFRWWKPMIKALKDASRPSRNKKNPRQKIEYQCAVCKKWFARTQVQIDHIIPCGQLRGYEDVVPFIKNLTQEDSKSYQVLCRPHHLVKTKQEKLDRKEKDVVSLQKQNIQHDKRKPNKGNAQHKKGRGKLQRPQGPKQLDVKAV